MCVCGGVCGVPGRAAKALVASGGKVINPIRRPRDAVGAALYGRRALRSQHVMQVYGCNAHQRVSSRDIGCGTWQDAGGRGCATALTEEALQPRVSRPPRLIGGLLCRDVITPRPGAVAVPAVASEPIGSACCYCWNTLCMQRGPRPKVHLQYPPSSSGPGTVRAWQPPKIMSSPPSALTTRASRGGAMMRAKAGSLQKRSWGTSKNSRPCDSLRPTGLHQKRRDATSCRRRLIRRGKRAGCSGGWSIRVADPSNRPFVQTKSSPPKFPAVCFASSHSRQAGACTRPHADCSSASSAPPSRWRDCHPAAPPPPLVGVSIWM